MKSTDSGAPEALLTPEALTSSRGLLDLPAIALSLSAIGGGRDYPMTPLPLPEGALISF